MITNISHKFVILNNLIVIRILAIADEISIGILDLDVFSKKNEITIKRDLERAGTLYTLKELLGTERFNLCYSSTNKPYLEGNSSHISISHSHTKLVVIMNELENTGIDIELIQDKVLKIRHKFLNETEFSFAKEDTLKLITIWAAKEALYKWYGLKNLDFKINISVEDFADEYIFGKIEAIDVKKKFRLKREKIENYMLVYILNELAD